MICRSCGAKLNDGARFCANCGQQIENAAQSTEINTPPHKINGQPVNSGNYNQNKPKKKPTALIVLAIAAAGILFLIGIFFVRAVRDAGQSGSLALQKDPYYDDVVRCMQGGWYVWEKDGTQRSIFIDRTHFTEYIHYDGLGATSQVYGDIETTDRKGELRIVENNRLREILYYTYDENTDSIELTCNGYTLGRNDVYGRIKELIQGQWIETDEKGNHYTLKINGTEFSLRVNMGTIYAGKVAIKQRGEINLLNADDTVLATIKYNYDEDTDSIVLTDGDSVFEKSKLSQ